MFNQAWSIFHYSEDELGSLITTAALKNILLGKDVISNHTALHECVMPFSRAVNDLRLWMHHAMFKGTD
jgi:hypothetical protein